ncbi:MAG: ABC transporter ATP-binding protein [Thermoprotei archaeon]
MKDVSLHIMHGEAVGLVGESGSGKTTLALAIAGLHDSPPVYVTKGSIFYKGRNLLDLPAEEMRAIRGIDLGFVMQETVSALNPVYTVGEQIEEAWRVRQKKSSSYKPWKQEALELLSDLCIDNAETVLSKYPHELSGGMRKRVAVAMAVIQRPELLILDEPTTGLDGFVQNRMVGVLQRLRKKYDMSMLVITHDLELASKLCDRVYVMYGGQIVEEGPATRVLSNPLHPYSKTLVSCKPGLYADCDRIPVPDCDGSDHAISFQGCQFRLRCPSSIEVCGERMPELIHMQDSLVRCWLYASRELGGTGG